MTDQPIKYQDFVVENDAVISTQNVAKDPSGQLFFDDIEPFLPYLRNTNPVVEHYYLGDSKEGRETDIYDILIHELNICDLPFHKTQPTFYYSFYDRESRQIAKCPMESRSYILKGFLFEDPLFLISKSLMPENYQVLLEDIWSEIVKAEFLFVSSITCRQVSDQSGLNPFRIVIRGILKENAYRATPLYKKEVIKNLHAISRLNKDIKDTGNEENIDSGDRQVVSGSTDPEQPDSDQEK